MFNVYINAASHMKGKEKEKAAKGTVPVSLFKPKFHYADFHRNFPAGKVVDTNHESRGHKR